MLRKTLWISIIILANALTAQAKLGVAKLSPSSWYLNTSIDTVLVVVQGQELTLAKIATQTPNVRILKSIPTLNPGFVAFEMAIMPAAQPGIVKIDFLENGKKAVTIDFPLLPKPAPRLPITTSDIIYQIVPDRFANGNRSNDSEKNMLEPADPFNPSGPHGGDLAGLTQRMPFIQNMGYTAIEITPFLESNQAANSYDRWATSDYYNIDSRLGTPSELQALTAKAQSMNIKAIATFVFNQASKNNPLVARAPFPEWTHSDQGIYAPVQMLPSHTDPYVSFIDRFANQAAWPDAATARLNMDEPLLQRYLTQHCIWWMATAGFDALKIDRSYTLPAAYLKSLVTAIRKAFPNATVITDLESANSLAHGPILSILNDNNVLNGDYPLAAVLENAFSDLNEPNAGVDAIYNLLANDVGLPHPYQNIVFADNHRTNRAFSNADKDLKQWKLIFTLLFTTRGIPQVTYGTEALLDGMATEGLGFVRKDQPGLNETDGCNIFTGTGLTHQQVAATAFLKQLINWRKNCAAAQSGKLVHYKPMEGLYVYFRHTGNQHVMVIINNHDTEKKRFEPMRYTEDIGEFTAGQDVLNNQSYNALDNIILSPKTAIVLELRKP